MHMVRYVGRYACRIYQPARRLKWNFIVSSCQLPAGYLWNHLVGKSPALRYQHICLLSNAFWTIFKTFSVQYNWKYSPEDSKCGANFFMSSRYIIHSYLFYWTLMRLLQHPADSSHVPTLVKVLKVGAGRASVSHGRLIFGWNH